MWSFVTSKWPLCVCVCVVTPLNWQDLSYFPFPCAGCKNCASVCPDVFGIEEDFGRARVYSQSGKSESVQQAVESWYVLVYILSSILQLFPFFLFFWETLKGNKVRTSGLSLCSANTCNRVFLTLKHIPTIYSCLGIAKNEWSRFYLFLGRCVIQTA